MFSTAVAWVVLVLVSFFMCFWVYDEYALYKRNVSQFYKTNYPKVIIFIIIWFISGVYLFG